MICSYQIQWGWGVRIDRSTFDNIGIAPIMEIGTPPFEFSFLPLGKWAYMLLSFLFLAVSIEFNSQSQVKCRRETSYLGSYGKE